MSSQTDTGPLLLFGDDGSTGADAAWLWVNMQTWPGWRVEVLTAVTPEIGPPPGPERGEPHAWTPIEPRHAFTEAQISELVHTTAEADPRHVLTVREDADVLVIGGKEEKGRKEFHLGSTAEYLMRRPSMPLVIARHATTVSSVLACVDGSPHAERAVTTLARLPWGPRIENVTLLSIEDRDTDPDGALASARSILGDLPVTARALGPEAGTADTILRAATDLGVQMIVMGTRGLPPLRRLLVGSTASAVTTRSTVSVLLAHSA